ncbi:MAG: nitroreductase family protein [Erysipelotrichaceae bacterium]|nr:nitroreductase family protein [Erysipelotrichaceae bacterium]MBQ1483356.1 nitroreductase family protein [Erysipelotrichaceae bacterium]
MEFFDVLENRSSIRKYTEEPLTEKEIYCIAAAGLKAPTATNKQEIRITVVKKDDPVQEKIQKDLNPEAQVNFYYDAPVTFYLSAADDFGWSDVDAGIAVENMHLAAKALGLGSVILGCMKKVVNGKKKEEYDKLLCIPEGYSYRIAIAVGHADTEKVPHNIDYDRDVTVK